MVDKDTKTIHDTADTSDEQNEDNSVSSGSYADEQEFSTVPCYRHDVVGSELQLDMERRRREEQDFEELQRMMVAGKLCQKEADMTEVKAREELEREFRLQQELLNDMKRQVEEEVKKRDEEQRCLARRQKEEEEKRKRGHDEDRWKMVQGKLKEEEEKNEKSKEANRKQRVEEEERRKKEEEVKRRKETESKPDVEMTRSTEEDDKRRKHVGEEQEMKVKREEVEARRKQTEEEEKRRTNEDDEGHKQLQEEPTMNKQEEERRKKAEMKLKEEKEMEEDKRKLADRRGKVEKEVEKRRKEQEEEIANWGGGEKRKQEAEVMQMQEEVMGKKEDEKGTSKKAGSKRQEEEGKVRRFVEKEESRREETKGSAIEDDEKKTSGEPMKERSQNTEEKEKRNKEAVRKKEEKAKGKKEEGGNKRSQQTEEEASSEMKDVEVEMRRKREVKNDLEQEYEKKGERRRIEEEEESDRMGRGEERMDKMEGGATECEERRKKIEEVDVKMKREEAERRSPESTEGEKRGKELEMNMEEAWEKSNIQAEKEDQETRTGEEEGRARANEDYDRWRCEKENQRTEGVEKRKKNEEGGRSEELQRKCAEEEERRKSDDTEMRKVKEKMEVKERMGPDEKLLEEEKSEEQRMKQKDEKMTGRRDEEERRNTKKSDESADEKNEELLTKNQHQRDASDPNIHQSITENIHDNIHRNSSCRSRLSRLTDQRRLSWMEVRVPCSVMENRSRRTSSFASRRESRRSGQDHDLPPLCPKALLRAAGGGSLQEVTILVLEDLAGCSLCTLAQCTRLQSLTMRRCGLKALEGISRLADLCYVDVPENEISRLDCEDMTGLRVLKMSCNKLTSIHGLSGAENLRILELSHNSIARIAGLDSLRRLQRLSLDHNRLVSTKGLKDVCTLLHLDCSYNHLASVEGLESNVLLRTLDLTSNSLSEPPALQDHVLLGELHMDDNSLASLRHLFSASWLPQLHTLTLAHNRLTYLPDMSVAVSLANLDLRFNCLSDVQDVCRSLEGCCSLDEVHLAGNPLQRESSWRCTLQAEVSSLRTIDGTDADILRTDSAVARQIDSGSGVLSLIRTQLHQMSDLQRQHTEQLSKVSRPLDAIKLSCGHLMETLHLAKEQRRSLERAHVGPTSASWTTLEESLDEVSPVASGAGCATPFCDVHASAVEGTRSSVQMVSHHQDWDLQSNSVASEVGGGYASYEGNPESTVQKSIIAQHHAATLIQARWRGFTLRRKLAAALAAVTSLEDDDDAFELVDVEEFVMDETTLEQGWTLCEDAPARCYSASKQPLPGIYPEHSQLVLPPLPKQRLTQAWEVRECEEKRVSPQSSNRKMSSSTSIASDFPERSERILEEWGFTNRHTAELMLRRALKMKSKQKSAGPSGQLEAWRNQPLTTCQLEPPNRLARRNRNATRVHQAETGPGRARWDQTREWLRNQNTLRHSESEHFLPNISTDLVSGGQRRLLAPEAGRMENQATGVWACDNLLAQDCRENKNTVGLPVVSGTPPPPCLSKSPNDLKVFLVQDIQVEQDIPTAWRKERISFRDEPVCRSSGWGGGKKRQKVKH